MDTAPPEIRLVLDFINTVNLEDAEEKLTDAAALGTWLAGAGVPAGRPAPTPKDLRRAIEVREALRALVGGNTGTPLPDGAREILDAAAARAGLHMRCLEDGSFAIEVSRGGVDGSLGRILAAAHRAMERGSWRSVKLCGRAQCRWAFYDASKNRSRRWCSMETCGNREKGQAFRARRREAAEG